MTGNLVAFNKGASMMWASARAQFLKGKNDAIRDGLDEVNVAQSSLQKSTMPPPAVRSPSRRKSMMLRIENE